MLFKSLSQ